MKKTIILIPAYNPTKDLITLIHKLKENEELDIIVVDDGSNEEGKAILNQIKNDVIFLSHKINLGKGAALKTGFRYVNENLKDVVGVITADADGQHSYKDILKISKSMKENSKNIILGVREFSNSIPKKSKYGNNITKFVFKIITGRYISDTQTGLRGIPSTYLEDMINIYGNRYEYEINMLLYIIDKKIDIDEIKIKTIYINQNEVSSFNPFKDSIKIYNQLLKYVFKKESVKYVLSSILAFIIDFVLLILFSKITNKLNNELSLFLSVIFSRIISSFINFNINRSIVFKSENKYLKDFINYYILAICILILNYFIIEKFYVRINLNLFISKFITEVIIFIVSFLVQKLLIFCKRERNEKGKYK